VTQPELAVTSWRATWTPTGKPWEAHRRRPRKKPLALAIAIKYPDATYKRNFSRNNANGAIRDSIKRAPIKCNPKNTQRLQESQNIVISKNPIPHKLIKQNRENITSPHKSNGLLVWKPPALTYAQACRPLPVRKRLPPIATPKSKKAKPHSAPHDINENTDLIQ
jgi:hypothetical protein